ncbi:helix-turn-helix transcriptional regulator [Clostridium sp.]|uniref:helix-turn-helix domain-containing protein n=1 Tax=Clostridium sp. TaxID=1506 RepID=UPI002604522A|nr:helix-turn-helix transcriptional regulator [Clostridium sp.]
MCTTLGKKIRDLRKANNMTMKELAEKLNLTEQAISQYERNIRIPNFEILKQIFSIFNKSVYDELKDLSDINTLEELYMLINQIKTGGFTSLDSIKSIIYPNLNIFNKLFSADDLNVLVGSLTIIDSIKNFIEIGDNIDSKNNGYGNKIAESFLNGFIFFDIPKGKKIIIKLEDIED